MADVWSANYSLFTSGQIITPVQIQEHWDLWFGHPSTIVDPFLNTNTVEESNNYLEEIQLPWRVSTLNIVDGIKQWTIA